MTSRMTRSGVEESERRESSAFKFRRPSSKAGLSKKISSRRLDHLRAFTRNQASRKGCNTCAWFKLWQIRLRSSAKSESRVSAVRELRKARQSGGGHFERNQAQGI